jgi:hypothetical protein
MTFLLDNKYKRYGKDGEDININKSGSKSRSKNK